MIKITIIGSGNVAQHLASAFSRSSQIRLAQVYSRSKNPGFALPETISFVHNFNDLAEADLYIIAVSDSAISAVSDQLPFKERLVVHTSGSMPLEILNSRNRKGVFYPLQTFSRNKEIDFNEIPICLESESAEDCALLKTVAAAVSSKIFQISGTQRKALHVAAVFVNNFVNHLYTIGNGICNENDIPFDILKPLIRETAEKIMLLTPEEAQTGPAIRKDFPTISAHLDFLSDPSQKTLYETLTQSILDHAKKL